ncbi:sigma D regulator [Pistricoccus aurantiacus]|uniref:Sigma D regulator n=1 Tax=Pistricoccus aurantiacus TaxID=1883414 RepID=A0A5B8SWN7_9GAMM|nr:sigma D regulator [Pistricoccus aurantiacus]QEA39200.1 sigma D regulator [Pistricoccus aurantiacus]
MLEHCKTAQERWGGVNQLIDRWLEQRRQLLVSFVALEAACDADFEEVEKPLIDEFSQLLMDYISAGHFEIYPQLREEARSFNDHQALALADQLLERLEMSTELVLGFDADYDTQALTEQNLPRLPAWLERLTKGLAARFNLEDQLIGRIHADRAPMNA